MVALSQLGTGSPFRLLGETLCLCVCLQHTQHIHKHALMHTPTEFNEWVTPSNPFLPPPLFFSPGFFFFFCSLFAHGPRAMIQFIHVFDTQPANSPFPSYRMVRSLFFFVRFLNQLDTLFTFLLPICVSSSFLSIALFLLCLSLSPHSFLPSSPYVYSFIADTNSLLPNPLPLVTLIPPLLT